MILDFHVHCFPDELASRAISALSECGGIPARLDGTVGSIKKSMLKAGISHSVVLPIATKPSQTQNINNWAAGIQDSEIFAFGSIHPDYEGWKDEINRVKELGLKGLKLHPEYQCFYVDEPRMFKMYECVFEAGLIISFHAGVDIGMPAPYHCTPDRLLKVVRAFPEARVIAAHMGGYSYWDDVENVLAGENIYFDTSYSIGWIHEEQLRRIIEKHGYERILFATDSPWTEQSGEIQKIRNLKLETLVEEAILGENAKRLLELR